MKLETVRVEHAGFPDGVLINASDFDPKVHVLFGAKPAPDGDTDPAKQDTSEGAADVTKPGKKGA